MSKIYTVDGKVPVGHPVLPSPEHVCSLVYQALPLQGIIFLIMNIAFSKKKL